MNSIDSDVFTADDLLIVLLADIHFVGSYTFDYNLFLQLVKTGYVRIHIYYSNLTCRSEIEYVAAQFKKQR